MDKQKIISELRQKLILGEIKGHEAAITLLIMYKKAVIEEVDIYPMLLNIHMANKESARGALIKAKELFDSELVQRILKDR